MLYVTLQGHDIKYDLENLLYTFYKREEITFIGEDQEEELTIEEEKIDVLSVYIDSRDDNWMYTVAVAFDANPAEEMPWTTKSGELESSSDSHAMLKKCKQEIKLAIYDLLNPHRPSTSPWGILVGVRPVKLVHELLDSGLSPEMVGLKLRDNYRIADEKIELALQIAEVERPYIENAKNDPISLYVCIPFCPTRCLYCSFPSNALGQKGKLVTPYLNALLKEIEEVAKMIRESGKRVDCIYIGGGTPTALNEDQLEILLEALKKHIGLNDLIEFTVEAGRPDSISEKKLQLMHDFGVDRICINPQTMNDETLKVIGRDHMSDDIESVYKLAKSIGFKTINMDLIIGLPGENIDSVYETMGRISELGPENVTLHTLAIKRSSRLSENLDSYKMTEKDTVESMMDAASSSLYGMDMQPYYMYRQKKILANLENIGYCKPGHESPYNIRIMEERHPIIALGAGAASKMVYLEENRFERVSNSKGVEDYIDRIDEMIEKKRVYLVGEKAMK